jgi:hypothetical protein
MDSAAFSFPNHSRGRSVDLTPKRPVDDIAGAHEVVIDAAPAVAVPAAAALTRDCILKIGVAIVLAHDLPRERRADPSEQFHRISPKPHRDAVERYPYRSDINAFHTPD